MTFTWREFYFFQDFLRRRNFVGEVFHGFFTLLVDALMRGPVNQAGSDRGEGKHRKFPKKRTAGALELDVPLEVRING